MNVLAVTPAPPPPPPPYINCQRILSETLDGLSQLDGWNLFLSLPLVPHRCPCRWFSLPPLVCAPRLNLRGRTGASSSFHVRCLWNYAVLHRWGPNHIKVLFVISSDNHKICFTWSLCTGRQARCARKYILSTARIEMLWTLFNLRKYQNDNLMKRKHEK